MTEDHVLDLRVRPDRHVEWKDEDELDAAVRQGRFTAAQGRQIRADGKAAAAVVGAWGSPFCDEWEHWRPDPTWPVPGLPDDVVAAADFG